MPEPYWSDVTVTLDGRKLDGVEAVAIFVLAIMAAACWAQIAAPCTWFAGAPAKDIPARCWEGFRP